MATHIWTARMATVAVRTMTIIRAVLTAVGNVVASLWKNLSPFFLVVTSGFGTWHIAQAYFSRYAGLPPPTGSRDELIFYLSLILPVFLMIGTMRYLEDEEAMNRRGRR